MSDSILAREEFNRSVVRALGQMAAGPYLSGSPLAGALLPPGEQSAAALRALLLETLEGLRPTRIGPGSATALRRYQHLVMRYVDGASTEQVCAALAISGRQARRDHREAIDALSENLWQWYVQSRAAATTSAKAPADVAPTPAHAGLDAELELLAPELAADQAGLSEVVSSAMGTVTRLAETAGVPCRVDVPAALTCPVNRSATRQALVHLLALAFDVEAAAGVTVTAREEHRTARIVIETHLIPGWPDGKPPPDVDGWVLRDERFQAARHLVEMVGGSIDLRESLPVSFEMVITLASSHPVRVLAIDDNPDILRLMQRYLAGSSYWLLPATTADRALELATTADPDVILLDVLMPSQDGWELLERIHQIPTCTHVPVIVCSVLREQALALSLGATDFLMKPITRPALLNALADHAAAPSGPRGSP